MPVTTIMAAIMAVASVTTGTLVILNGLTRQFQSKATVAVAGASAMAFFATLTVGGLAFGVVGAIPTYVALLGIVGAPAFLRALMIH